MSYLLHNAMYNIFIQVGGVEFHHIDDELEEIHQ